jgi:GDP-4-dehydro-6-deoxy-D-mannose reductase
MACSAFAKQIAICEKAGKKGTVEVGNLDSMRDFTDVRDAVRAYMLLVEKGRPGTIYNICSEKAVCIGDCLDILLKESRVKIDLKNAQSRIQINDVPKQLGNAEKLKKMTGWKPEITVRQSLIDLLNYWRINLKEGTWK